MNRMEGVGLDRHLSQSDEAQLAEPQITNSDRELLVAIKEAAAAVEREARPLLAALSMCEKLHGITFGGYDKTREAIETLTAALREWAGTWEITDEDGRTRYVTLDEGADWDEVAPIVRAIAGEQLVFAGGAWIGHVYRADLMGTTTAKRYAVRRENPFASVARVPGIG